MTTRRLLFIATLFFTFALTASAQLPRTSLKNLMGRTVDTDTIGTGGQPVIVDFFATWCKPCNRELDAIAEVYDDWRKETGLRIVAISIDKAQDTHKVRPLVETQGWEYDVLLDPNMDLARALGIKQIPYTLIIDGKGNIVYRHNGYTDGAEQELIDKVRELTGK